MLVRRSNEVESARSIPPDGHYIASKASCTSTGLESSHNTLLVNRQPVTQLRVDENDDYVHPLDVKMSNLEAFHKAIVARYGEGREARRFP